MAAFLGTRARECGTLPLAFVLFSFFFTLLSLADELLSAAARPVIRACIGGENSLFASGCKTLEAAQKKSLCVQIEPQLPYRCRFTVRSSPIDTDFLPAIARGPSVPHCVDCAK